MKTSFNVDFNSTINLAQGAIEGNVENLVAGITDEINLFTEDDLIFDCIIDYFLTANLKHTGLIKTVSTVVCFLSRIRGLERDRELQRSLQELQELIPDLDRDKKKFDKWCQFNSQAWIKQLREVMIKYRNIGHEWQFSNEQKKLLQQYYDANKLLVDCLNSDCYVSREVRQQIEDTLLLPIAEIKQHQQQS
ncbi:NACHT C-terminal helical domain 2-containing protein [Nostoc sp.]|uniref:NACHT C-terminal helical domain 2-containing protein n=1 Tax=Nostoc sp. TaxID=1180 RepID=UPI002FFA7073